MTDAGPGRGDVPARRRGGRLLSAVAALLVIGGGGVVAFGALHQVPDPPSPSVGAASSADAPTAPTSSPARASTPATRAPRPVALRIPSIGVRSRLSVVGLNRDGSLAVPKPGKDYDKAAWFTGSPAPGAVGPAVIEGHVDGKVNGPSVFYRLGSVKPGERVTVTRADGSVVRFVVYAVRSYAKDEFPTFSVYRNTAGPELRLITCGGPFDRSRARSGYTRNTVVFARQA